MTAAQQAAPQRVPARAALDELRAQAPNVGPFYPGSNTPIASPTLASQQIYGGQLQQLPPMSPQQKFDMQASAAQQRQATSASQGVPSRSPVIQPPNRTNPFNALPLGGTQPNMFTGVSNRQSAPAADTRSGRGGGRGGGGGKREKSAGELAREMDRKNKAKERSDKWARKRSDDEWARENGYNSAKDYEEKQAREDRKRENEAKAIVEKERKDAKDAANKERVKAEMEQMKTAEKEKRRIEQQSKPAAQEGTGPRMTRAYGNPYAKLVRARGDFA